MPSAQVTEPASALPQASAHVSSPIEGIVPRFRLCVVVVCVVVVVDGGLTGGFDGGTVGGVYVFTNCGSDSFA